MKEKNNKKIRINILAVLLAFIIGITVGNMDTDKLRKAENYGTSDISFIKREETVSYRKAIEKSGEEKAESETASGDLYFAVYITPAGKRYHIDADCAGEGKSECMLEDATDRGLTPCKRCADG